MSKSLKKEGRVLRSRKRHKTVNQKAASAAGSGLAGHNPVLRADRNIRDHDSVLLHAIERNNWREIE